MEHLGGDGFEVEGGLGAVEPCVTGAGLVY